MNRRRSDVGLSTFSNAAHGLYKSLKSNRSGKLRESKKETLSSLKSNISEYGNWQKFNDEIEELFRSEKKDGYYSWKGLLYMLYEYEEMKRGREEAEKLNYDKITKKNSIEHIYPQNPKDEYWLNRFGDLTDKENDKKLHSIGNLMLLTRGKNSKIKNYSYKKKVGEYKISNYSANEVAKNYPKEWTPRKIKNRENDLISFIKKRWAFDQINKTSLDEKDKKMIEDENNEEIEAKEV
jgi:hypothetical protein